MLIKQFGLSWDTGRVYLAQSGDAARDVWAPQCGNNMIGTSDVKAFLRKKSPGKEKNIFMDPRDLFDMDLIAEISEWREQDDEVILMGDFNQDIYRGSLGKHLRSDDIGMTEQFKKLFDEDAPFSHATGQTPICGVFATCGIECVAAFISQHGSGVGDHRLNVFDFSAESLLGLLAPATVKPAGRNLQCCIERSRINYTRVLMQLTTRHRMFKKVNHIKDHHGVMTEAEFQLLYNAWDTELLELMLASEKRCRKLKMITFHSHR